jgi:hypothetical protein
MRALLKQFQVNLTWIAGSQPSIEVDALSTARMLPSLVIGSMPITAQAWAASPKAEY